MSENIDPSSHDDTAFARLRAEMLDECYPLPVAHVLCDVVPVEGLLWQCLPAAWRVTTCNLLLSFNKESRMFGEGSFSYAMLVLATPALDDAERRDEFLLPTKRCAKSRRRLVAMLRENETAIDAIIDTVSVDAAGMGLLTADMPAYTAFQLMLLTVAKSGAGYDTDAVHAMLCEFLHRADLPNDSIQDRVINAKALAFEARFSEHARVPEHHEVAPAGTVLH
ncbi:hypothetical protein [Paraburkholderia tropica]|uniref:hypothetical protein n=1 Tax=Paraburkholderia tropica TaxID=92647 RepID=UPI0031D90AB8